MTLDAATRQHARRERDRRKRIDLGLLPGSTRHNTGLNPAGRPALRDNHEAWVAEIEKALAAHEQTLVNA